MHSFRKVLISIISIITVIVLVSAIVICPYYDSEVFYYEDKQLRRDLSGTLDYLVVGSSHGLAAFKTSILDNELECNSYNLSGGMMTFASRYFLLKKEIERNPVKTVVIEVSHNALTSDNDDGYGEGDSAFLPRLDNVIERFDYLVKYVDINSWMNIYAKVFIQGLSYYKYRGRSAVDYETKGYHPKETRDITLKKEIVAENYNNSTMSIDFTENNIGFLKKMVDLCKDNGIRVIIAVTPISDIPLWRCDNFDDFQKWLIDFCLKSNCELYNFNLLKNRYELFNDSTSFYDALHLSDEGATVFTKEYTEIMKKLDQGNDINDLFFSSYAEMKQYSPYMIYMKDDH